MLAGVREPVPPMVSYFTEGWGRANETTVSSVPASAVYESANRGVWYPIYIPATCVAKRMWWGNGATVDAGYSVEAGIYLDGGHKPGAKLITTGSVAQGTASQVQFADITDTGLSPGLYWLFFSCDNTTATILRANPNSGTDELHKFQQASIGPGSAPATATPVESTATNIYLVGFSTTTIT